MFRKGFVVTLLIAVAFCWTYSVEASKGIDDQALEAMRAEIAAKGYSYTVGYNSATSRSIDELCGLRVPPGWWKDAPTQPLPVMDAALPTSFDWRDYGGVSPVKDQGSCGSCWAFGTVGILESLIMTSGGPTEDLSEQYLVSCNDDGYGCNGGWFAHNYHIVDGAVYESCRPYVAADTACQCACTHPYRLNNWYYVSGSNSVPSTDAIKTAIYNYGPVAVAVYVNSAFQAYTGGVFTGTASGSVNHAVILVGWNDAGGYWIMKNSWNTGWGINGYMHIAYGSQQIGYAANYVVGYQSGNWPADDDCGGGCTNQMTSSNEVLTSLAQLRADYPNSPLVTAIDDLSKAHDAEIREVVGRNPMLRHIIQRGLWTNLTAIQEGKGALDTRDFLRAIKLAKPMVSRALAADLQELQQLLRQAHGQDISQL